MKLYSVVIRIKKNIFSDWFCDYQFLAYFDNPDL